MKAATARALRRKTQDARRKTEAVPAPIQRGSRDTAIPNNETPKMRLLEIFDRSGSDHSLKPLDQAVLVVLGLAVLGLAVSPRARPGA